MTTMNWLKGMVAGFAATIVLSVLMLLKGAIGLAPEFGVASMLGGLLGSADTATVWIGFFVFGTVVLGTLYAWLDPDLPGGDHWLKAVIFSLAIWLALMIIAMPLAGLGFFGTSYGVAVAAVSLVMYVIFGIALGAIYGLEHPEPGHGFLTSH